MSTRRIQRACAALLIVPLFAPADRTIPLDNVTFEVRPGREAGILVATIETRIAIPLGSLPVRGAVTLHYTCDGNVTGRVEFPSALRVLARVKGIRLVSVVHGTIDPAADAGCVRAPDTLDGRVSIRDSVVDGEVRVRGEALPLSGYARPSGTNGFSAELIVPAGESMRAARITLS